MAWRVLRELTPAQERWGKWAAAIVNCGIPRDRSILIYGGVMHYDDREIHDFCAVLDTIQEDPGGASMLTGYHDVGVPSLLAARLREAAAQEGA